MNKNIVRGLVAVGVLAVSGAASAADNPIVVLINSIDITTVAAAIAVLGLALVGIKLTMKGPDVAGRVIKKI